MPNNESTHGQEAKMTLNLPLQRRVLLPLAAAMLFTASTAAPAQTPVTAPAQQQPRAQVPAANARPVNTVPAQAQKPPPQSLAAKLHSLFGARSTTPAQGASAAAPAGNAAGSNAAPANAAPANSNAVKHFFDSFTHRGNTPGAAPGGGTAAAAPGNTAMSTALKHLSGAGTGSGTAAATRTTDNHVRLASLNSNQAVSARTVQSQTFLGHPAPPGSREEVTPGGSVVRKAADGSVLDVHDPKSGVSIQHGLDGSKRVSVEQPDGSRIYAPSRGTGYVQHPYLFHAQPFDHRSSIQQGQLTHQFYRPYTFAGATLDAYAPQRFYSPDVYRWAGSRYPTPLHPQWNFVSTPTPWYSYYKGFFTPETSYSSPVGWLTDFVLATTLISAYNTHTPAKGAEPPAQAGAIITPDVKDKVSDEVARQVHRESIEAQENAQSKTPAPGAGGVVQELNDRQPHVFVVSSDIDLVDPSGRRCMVSQGDVVQVMSAANPASGTATSVVLASKGTPECERAAQVEIAVTDLQEMQNHMRETIDQGMAKTSVGSQAPTETAPYAAAAPPPDPNTAREIEQQKEIAAAADG